FVAAKSRDDGKLSHLGPDRDLLGFLPMRSIHLRSGVRFRLASGCIRLSTARAADPIRDRDPTLYRCVSDPHVLTVALVAGGRVDYVRRLLDCLSATAGSRSSPLAFKAQGFQKSWHP